jgi:hypothetical protein
MAWAPLCVLPDQGEMMEDVHDSQAQWIHPAIGKGALTDRNNMKKWDENGTRMGFFC